MADALSAPPLAGPPAEGAAPRYDLAAVWNDQIAEEFVARGLRFDGEDCDDLDDEQPDAALLAEARSRLMRGDVDEALIMLGRALSAAYGNEVFSNLRDVVARHYGR